ncbi:MAG: thioesterase family protein, partial [Bacillota bacterium]|nr:thioesterase family protein [Bacillota bacterium]
LNSKIETIVKEKDTAANFGSGGVEVFATPMMIGLMENAALSAVDLHLPKGYATVGTHLDVKHLAATPIGMKVYATAELIEIDGKRLVFKVEAYDEKEKIGEGMHERYIINLERFLDKTAEKKNS